MKKIIAFAALALCFVPLTSFAASTAKKAAAPTIYICSKCHMKFPAAVAKKDHFKDPMDGGTLVPVKPTNANDIKKPASSANSMGM